MPTIDELKEQLESIRARQAKAQLSEAEAEHHRLLERIAEERADMRVAEAKRRATVAAALKVEAEKVAAGRYLVGYFDLGALLPDADPEKLPGEGILILRSPPVVPVDVLAVFHREVEAKERSLVDCYIDLVCSSVVAPDVSNHEIGMRFRSFLESSIGHGTAITIGDAVSVLGGARARATKRGR